MALSYGQHPDHSTIAAFFSSMKDEIEKLREILRPESCINNLEWIYKKHKFK